MKKKYAWSFDRFLKREYNSKGKNQIITVRISQCLHIFTKIIHR